MKIPITQEELERQRKISEELQSDKSERIERMKEELEALVAEKHKTLRQVDGKLRRGSNHQPKKKKRK